MVGGPRLSAPRPVLQATGKTITHGESGAGQIAKPPIRPWWLLRWCDGRFVFFKKPGPIRKSGRGICAALRKGRWMSSRCRLMETGTGFKAYNIQRPKIIMETARQYGVPLPSVAVDAQLFAALLQLGMAELDNSAVIAVIEALAGVELLD
jgi:2-hydroxy-3-oxopropionate reductase